MDDRETGGSGTALVAVGGVLASGKSTVSRTLAEQLAAVRIEADELRAAFERAGESEAFVPGFSDVVYEQMFADADKALGEGRPVVLDGTFRSRERRSHARQLAERHGAVFRFVECRAAERVIRARLCEREDPEGWLAMYEHFLTIWEPVDELPAGELHTVDTSQPSTPIPEPEQLGLEPA
ncbi:MAG: AAA family ATPase [Myxococcota bacterium]